MIRQILNASADNPVYLVVDHPDAAQEDGFKAGDREVLTTTV